MRSSIQQKDLEPAEQKAEKRRIRDIFVSPGTRKAALVITVVLPALLMAYAWFMNHRPPLHIKSEWTLQDTLIQNSDLFLSFVFLIVSALPFYLVFDRKKVKARELTPIALMAALCVVGRAAFSLIPLPNFKPVSAIIIITALAFGPEAGYLTGALAAILSNFLFGQGPWDALADVLLGALRISGRRPSEAWRLRPGGRDGGQCKREAAKVHRIVRLRLLKRLPLRLDHESVLHHWLGTAIQLEGSRGRLRLELLL